MGPRKLSVSCARRWALTVLVALSAGLASRVAADTGMEMREGTSIAGDASELPEAMRKAFARRHSEETP